MDWNLQQREGECFSFSATQAPVRVLIKKAQAPVVLMMMPVKVTRCEDESDVQSQSANGGMKRVLHKHSAQMPRKKSPAEVDLNNGKVTAHGLEWKFVDDVSVDAYKDNRHKPKLRVAGPAIVCLDF